MSAPLLEVTGLSVAFGARRVASDVGFALERGGALAIVGESGSGKSMSMAAIAGLTPPNAVARGIARFDGIDMLAADDRELAGIRGRRIGFVFQDALGALNPFMRIGRQIGEGIRHHLRLDRDATRRRVAELLEEVGLRPATAYADRFAHQLSGGQRQRVAIAMAIACDPDLLVADEPTSALDVTIQAQILDLLGRLRASRGLALILVSHDLAIVERICDQVLVMRAGEVVESGKLADVFAAPGHAYTRELLAARAPSVPRASVDAIGAPVAELRHVEISYPLGFGRGRVAALRGVSMRIGHGESVGLVGESGSGKSTVARALVGLARVDAGSVRVLDVDPVATRDRRGFARRCQIVMQDPAGALNPRLRVRDALAEPLTEHGLCGRAELGARCAALLGEVGLDAEHLERFPHQLSGGQRQRVVIARALALDPTLLICDEPVSALDMSIQRQILDLLAAIRARRSLSILFISHDLRAVGTLCDRVVVMKDGVVVEAGPIDRILTRPAHAYTRELIAAAALTADPAGGGSAAPAARPPRDHQSAVSRAWRQPAIT